MIEAAFTFGLVIFVGLMALAGAAPRWLRFFLLRHHFMTSTIVSALTLWIHWGTMTGLMSATIAGLMASVACFIGRWYWRMA